MLTPTPKRTHPILKLIDERFKNKFVRGWVGGGRRGLIRQFHPSSIWIIIHPCIPISFNRFQFSNGKMKKSHAKLNKVLHVKFQ
jgi:hypothetical protein